MSEKPPKQSFIESKVAKLDDLQQRHHWLAFPYAVIKKFSDDEAAYQAALMAYYGFLSLFPLLIVATTIAQILSRQNFELRDRISQAVSSYFPAIGDTLTRSVSTPSKTGFALVIALLITLYGARGVAGAVQHSLNHVWAIPRSKRPSFPNSLFKSIGILVFGGIGLLLSAALIGYATATDHNFIPRVLLGTAGFIVLFSVFWSIFVFGSAGRRRPIMNVTGALVASVGMLILQAIGGYLISNQLRNQTSLNAQFAVVLVMLFWLYLQATVFLYAVELNTVRAHHLWPRSIRPHPPLPADLRAYELYKKREEFDPDAGMRH